MKKTKATISLSQILLPVTAFVVTLAGTSICDAQNFPAAQPEDQQEPTDDGASPSAPAPLPIPSITGSLQSAPPTLNARAFGQDKREWDCEQHGPAMGADDQQAAPQPTQNPPAQAPPAWQYGAFLDFGYLWDNNHPANETFRSRGTAYKVDVPIINMSGAYLRKTPSESSRWGAELTVQVGHDTRVFGFSATAPNLPGYQGLRHLGPTNVSYLAPVGKGLTIQGGIFSSFIGYDSLYTKDNFTYTRPWGADFTPYLMLGVNANYPFTDKLTGTFFILNGYWHLANANSVPSWGGQLAYKPNDHWTLKETVLVGPYQPETGLEFWRLLSDSIVEWKREPFTVALEFQGSTEKVSAPGNPRASWVSVQLPTHWAFNKHWAATLRPEVAWDSDGRWTGVPQTVKAVTSTIEYRVLFHKATAIFRVEHRVDDSRGAGGGFFRGREIAPGVVGITPSQHLLVFAAIFTFDAQHR